MIDKDNLKVKGGPQAMVYVEAASLPGITLEFIREGFADSNLPAGHSTVHYLREGESITIKAKAVDNPAGLTDLDKAAADDIAANPKAGPDLADAKEAKTRSKGKGQTLEEGLEQKDDQAPDVEPAAASSGVVVSDTGPTRTTRTVKPIR